MKVSFEQSLDMTMWGKLILFIKWIFVWISSFYHTKIDIYDKKTQKALRSIKGEKEYLDECVQKFHSVIDQKEMNTNIHSVFYDYKQFKSELIECPKNPWEKEWKTRQLWISTPRGNIFMYYDAYKMGFAYYSDQMMPYSILNAVAMKYVIMFRCIDFFIDEFVIPTTYKNPLIQVHEIEQEENKNKSKPMFLDSGAAFLRKKYDFHDQKNQKQQDSKDSLKRMNRFIHLGTLRNIRVIPSKSSLNHLNQFESNLLPKQTLTYKQYKSK